MKYFRDAEDFERVLRELRKSPEMLPIFVWFFEEG